MAYRSKLSKFTLGLCLFALLFWMVAIIQAAIFEVPPEGNQFFYTRGVFANRALAQKDSWQPMLAAIKHIRSADPRPVYSEVFFAQKIKFQYPPSSLLFICPVAGLRPGQAEAIISLLNSISFFFLILILVLVPAILSTSIKQNLEPGPEHDSRLDAGLRFLVTGGLALTFYPLVWGYDVGQIQTWITAFFCLAVYLWVEGKPLPAGLLVGCMTLIKPHYSLLLLWGLLRKQWKFVAAGLAVCLAGLVVSIQLFGWPNHLDYIRVVQFLSQHGESYYHNQSMNGLMNRLVVSGNNLVFDPHGFPPATRLVGIVTIAFAVLLLILALFAPLKTDWRSSAVDLSLMAVTITVSSPVAWEHHYGILLPVFALIAPVAVTHPALGKSTIPYLCLSYFLTAMIIWPTRAFSRSGMLTVFQSTLFVGALLLIGFIYALVLKKTFAIDKRVS